MNKISSILLILMSFLVMAHVVVPHHHHHDRIYLIMEENHENHDGHPSGENKCHHGNLIDEVLVCASTSYSFEHKQIFIQPLFDVFYTVGLNMTYIFKKLDGLFSLNIYIPKGPPLFLWSLRAPPCI